jgi:hypothetical protein
VLTCKISQFLIKFVHALKKAKSFVSITLTKVQGIP